MMTNERKMTQQEWDAAHDETSRLHTALTGCDDNGQPVNTVAAVEPLSPVAQLKTSDELAHLKANWLGDPCWDIEDTKGFEAHYNELRDWRFNLEETEAIKEENRLMTKAVTLGCTVELVGYIETLERRLARLEAQS